MRSSAEAEISRQYLERASDRYPWMVGDDGEVAGRLLGCDDRDSDSPHKLVVDGRTISWASAW